MPKRLPPGATPRAAISRHEEYPTIRIQLSTRDRLDRRRGLTSEMRAALAANPRLKLPASVRSYDAELNALMDLAERNESPSVPVESLEPVSQALHEVERQVQGNRFRSPDELLKAVRSVRHQIEELTNR